jgi:hypothetical protein
MATNYLSTNQIATIKSSLYDVRETLHNNSATVYFISQNNIELNRNEFGRVTKYSSYNVTKCLVEFLGSTASELSEESFNEPQEKIKVSIILTDLDLTSNLMNLNIKTDFIKVYSNTYKIQIIGLDGYFDTSPILMEIYAYRSDDLIENV